MTKKAVRVKGADPENMGSWENAEPRTERVEISPDDELDEVMEGFPQNEACIELSRVNAQGGRPAFLEEMMPSAFSFAYVTKTYGGGRYMAKGKYASGTKKKMFFEIEGDPFPVRRKVANPDPQAPVLPNAIRSVEAESLPVLKGDGSDLSAAMLGMFKTLIQQSQASEMQMLEKMKIYKELFGAGGVAREAPLDQLLNMFQKGVDLAGRGGGGGEESFWLMAIRELKDPLLKIVETVQTAIAKPPMNVNTRSGVQAIEPMKPGGEPVVAQGGEDPMVSLMPVIKTMLPSLVNGASKNSDPDLYVDFLLDQIPESAYPAFQQWLMKPGCLDQLAFLEPGVRFQRDWWESLRTQLIVAIHEALKGSSGNSNLQSVTDSDTSVGDSADSEHLP